MSEPTYDQYEAPTERLLRSMSGWRDKHGEHTVAQWHRAADLMDDRRLVQAAIAALLLEGSKGHQAMQRYAQDIVRLHG